MKQNELLNEVISKSNFLKKIILSIILAIVLQLCLIYIFELSYFDILSFVQNWLLILYISSFNTDSNSKNFILILITVFLIIDFFILKRYIGQTLILIPFTSIGHLSINMQKMQNYNSFKYHLNSTLIDLNKEKPNFWYEYHNFKHNDDFYYVVLIIPGKYDEFISVLVYSLNLISFESKHYFDKLINRKYYNIEKSVDYNKSYITTHQIQYLYEVNFKSKSTILKIELDNISILVNSKISTTDNYSGIANVKYILPILPKYLIRLGGISDKYPYESLNDVAVTSHSEVIINNKLDINSFSWFDRYVGDGYYYMTNYLWTLHYGKNWNIFILFYTDYPYKDGVCVTYFFNKQTNKMIEISNFYPYSDYNNQLSGTKCTINTFGTKLSDEEMKFNIEYKSPKIECSIKSIKNKKVLGNFKLYKRNNNLNQYGKGEELHKITEQLSYHEFAGYSKFTLKYNNIKYDEEAICVIDGICWENNRKGPKCYKLTDKPFFQNKFYVEATNKDILNKKIKDCV
tara:strand:+ start:170 stop:1717 length:1548 start_codon:yes stop_codon:yes gene_type:complete